MARTVGTRIIYSAAAMIVLALLTAACGKEAGEPPTSGQPNETLAPSGHSNDNSAATNDQNDNPVPSVDGVEGNQEQQGDEDSATGGASNAPGSSSAESDEIADYTVIGSGLNIPWSIAFDEKTIYVSEREGNIVRLKDGDIERMTVRLTKSVHHDGEGGFLGLLLAPDFHESGLAYAYHTYREREETFNRVVLLALEGSEWSERSELLSGIPGDLYHNGGRMAYGPDGMLYITTGDATEQALSQKKDSLGGKILRMTLKGEVPDDNPWPDSYVYSYGHRNAQGLAWSADGTLYSTEHGPSGRPGGHDEINRIAPGANYGWPVIMGDAASKGMETPLYHTGEKAIAPSGTIIDGQGRLLIAALRGEAIYRYTPESGKMEVFHDGEGRIRDLTLRDGVLYFITNNRDGRGQPSNTDDRLVAIKYE